MSKISALEPSYYFSFNQLKSHEKMVVNDSVMGGRSNSYFHEKEDYLLFSGTVSLENNGGFASLRMLWPFSVKQKMNTLRLRVKGDGKVYQFRLRTNRGFDGAAYVYQFKTEANEWQNIDMPLADFVPQFRGRSLTGMPQLLFSDVQQMGVLIAAKQVGDFTIKLSELSLFKIN